MVAVGFRTSCSVYQCLRQFRPRPRLKYRNPDVQRRKLHSSTDKQNPATSSNASSLPFSKAKPAESDFAQTAFADKISLTLTGGAGGHGCVSFLREKFIAQGPPNGGDGGTGGGIYIQALASEKSLHKLSSKRILHAGRGGHGQGKSKGGKRGEDLLLTVPVGTIVRERARRDPVEEAKRAKRDQDLDQDDLSNSTSPRDQWIFHPSETPKGPASMKVPQRPPRRPPTLVAAQPAAPIFIDLTEPMEKPALLLAGSSGGLGNPHFLTQSMPRPHFASKGEKGVTLELDLELKLLADVGFVGLPNAGKSTLLRALSRSRARVGDWAFTTLQPNIGTMVLDDHRERPKFQTRQANGESRTQISIADIPGLIEDAHLDRGLGLDFLRHIERAQVLAFVVDLSQGSAVTTLESLWKELREFERIKMQEACEKTDPPRTVAWRPAGAPSLKQEGSIAPTFKSQHEAKLAFSSNMSSKPWFVAATKADLKATKQNFEELSKYLSGVNLRTIEHPSQMPNAWRGQIAALPVSGLRAEGIDRIPRWIMHLLNT